MKLKIVLLGLLVTGTVFSQQRPITQWAQRGVMVGKGRILFLALTNNVTLAYETQNCGLYMAWDGGLEDGNSFYDHQGGGNHGATIYPKGTVMHRQSSSNADAITRAQETRGKTHTTPNTPPLKIWTLLNGNSEVNTTLDYRGYTMDNTANTVTLMYHIKAGNNTIEVRETPNASGNAKTVTRNFVISGLPQGQTLRLKLDGESGSESWTADGVGAVAAVGGKDHVTFSGNGNSTVVGNW